MSHPYLGHALVPDEQATIDTMTQNAEAIDLLPTHCINSKNEMQGFRLKVCADAKGSALCVNRTMFFGHSLFECYSADNIINQDVVRLMGRDNVADMQELMDSFNHREVATLGCIPQNTDALMSSDLMSVNVSYASGRRYVDSKPWRPDQPLRMGLYHAMVRGYQKDNRQHKLFVAVSGGCSKCCDMFYNLLMDVGDQWTAKEVFDSEEVWWLRKACQRARCMVASQVAQKFGLTIQEYNDTHSYNTQKIAVPTVDTIEHNIVSSDGYVSITNHCSEVSLHQNGLLCAMHPVEGYWLFRGNTRSSTKVTNFGSLHSCNFGVFPTNAPRYKIGYGSPSYVGGHDNRLIVRSAPVSKDHVYQCFDEHFLRTLSDMGWNRDHGVVELMPIIVGVSE